MTYGYPSQFDIHGSPRVLTMATGSAGKSIVVSLWFV